MSIITYSVDLRERVIDYIKLGNSQVSTSKIFKVSKSAVSRWWARYKKEGVTSPIARSGSKGRGKINIEQLKKLVEENGDQTLAMMAETFKVSASAVSQQLKKHGFSYKKKPSATWKRAPKKEENI